MSFAVEYKFPCHQVKYIMLSKRFLHREATEAISFKYIDSRLNSLGCETLQLPSWKSVFIPAERWFHVCQDVWCMYVCMYVCWLKKNLLLNKWFDNSISKSSVAVRQLVPWWKDLCQIYGLQQHCEQICRGKEILFQLEFSFSLEPKINCLKELLEH